MFERRENLLRQQRDYLSSTGTGGMAGKATLYSRQDSAPKHAKHGSSRERRYSPAHTGRCFGIRTKFYGFCQRFTERYIITVQIHSDNIINLEYVQSAIIAMQSLSGRRFCKFRKEKKTLFFPVSPFSIDSFELNTIALEGVSQSDFETELDNIADKDICISFDFQNMECSPQCA